MANWNDNRSQQFNWHPQAPPFYPSNNSSRQQYVGFNDFLNQYQMYNNDYQINYNQYQQATPNQYGRRNQYNSNYNNTQGYNNGLSQQHYQGINNTSQVPLSTDNNQTNTDSNNSQKALRSNKKDNSLVSTSKLTATAQEFVPQSSKTHTEVEQNKETTSTDEQQSTSANIDVPSTSKSENIPNKSQYNNNRKGYAKNKYENSNWRSRDDDVPEQSTSTKQSVVFHNSNNRNQGEDRYSKSARDKPKERDERNSSHDYNNRSSSSYSNVKYNRDGYRSRDVNVESKKNSRDRYDNGSDESKERYNNKSHRNQYNDSSSAENKNRSHNNSRSKNSYSTNESFKHREGNSKDRNESSKNQKKSYEADKYEKISPFKDNANIGQRERLVDQLNRGSLECLVCCERVRQQDAVWSCGSCFHVLHLSCIKKWASSSLLDGSWRCPACQNQLSTIPSAYHCFCGSQRNPEWHRGGSDTAHSCGDVCNKTRSCPLHPCMLQCHPGPCPVCESIVQKKCECGATQQQLKCSNKSPLLCNGVCGKTLECGVHTCEEKCHSECCAPCKEQVHQKCYCPKQTERTVVCESSTVGVNGYSCGDVCDRTRACGNHKCPEICHPGPCPQCPLSPELTTHCPCGQTRLEKERKSCLDPIQTCDKSCCLPLDCGPNDNLHTCPEPCHAAPCPPCKLRTPVSCRCGHITKDVPCVQLQEVKDTVRCGRKCTKKQSCGRHKCKETCCIDTEHKCPLPCTRTLSCGLHRCEDTCHRGHCQPCWRVSFEELRCRCGASVRYPPVECGARPPSCSQPCTVVRPCGHPPHHTCHPAHTHCPPCTVLTQQYCHGKHKLRKTIPCHQQEFSCGLPCGKDMPCGKHKCIESCHKGDCPSVCTQLCKTKRHGCDHFCGAKCGHPAPCPSTSPCKAPVTAKCPCGRRSEVRPCFEQTAAQRKLQVLLGPLGEPVDISELIKRGSNDVTLECDSDCQTEDRNRRLAIGLQIRNPDLSSKLAPKYSDFLKQMCTRDENFATRIHDQLRQLVVLSKESKQRTRSHSFQPMSRPKREFVHELCQHFGCESVSYDSEPYRNIVATAYKERSWLPAMSLMEVVRRDKGQRKVPPPILNSNSSSGGSAWATLGSSSTTNTTTTTSSAPEPPRKPRIDYFDMPPED